MVRTPVLICSLMTFLVFAGTACKNPFTPKVDVIDSSGQQTPDEWLPLTTHGNVMKNFLYVYNFREKQLSAREAKQLYAQLFLQDDGSSYRYEFQVFDPLDPEKITLSYFIDEELASNEALFDNVESEGLYLTLVLRDKLDGYDIERAETPGTGHEGEDWYVYNYSTRLEMENPAPGAFPFLVQGEVIFKIRLCSDGLYRIVRWLDFTTPEPGNGTAL